MCTARCLLWQGALFPASTHWEGGRPLFADRIVGSFCCDVSCHCNKLVTIRGHIPLFVTWDEGPALHNFKHWQTSRRPFFTLQIFELKKATATASHCLQCALCWPSLNVSSRTPRLNWASPGRAGITSGHHTIRIQIAGLQHRCDSVVQVLATSTRLFICIWHCSHIHVATRAEGACRQALAQWRMKISRCHSQHIALVDGLHDAQTDCRRVYAQLSTGVILHEAPEVVDARAQWARDMRRLFSPPAMLEGDGRIRQEFFKPKHVRLLCSFFVLARGHLHVYHRIVNALPHYASSVADNPQTTKSTVMRDQVVLVDEKKWGAEERELLYQVIECATIIFIQRALLCAVANNQRLL